YAVEADAPAETLRARSAMNRHGGDSNLFKRPGEFVSRDVSVGPAPPHFDAHRNAHGLHDPLDELDRFVAPAHHAGPRAIFDDFIHRAAHVDVDRRYATGLEQPRRFDHHPGLTAEDLDGERLI